MLVRSDGSRVDYTPQQLTYKLDVQARCGKTQLSLHQDTAKETHHIMSLLSQLFSIVYTPIIRSSTTKALAYTNEHHLYSIDMTDLPQHCHFPERHHHHNPILNDSNDDRPLRTRCEPYKTTDSFQHRPPPLHYETILNSHDGINELPYKSRSLTSRRPSLPLDASPSHPSTYLCTFCWRPQRTASTPSRVVGRRNRLACKLCYNSLLDLAIC